MSTKKKRNRRGCYSGLVAKLKTLKPGGCVSVPIPTGSDFDKMYNTLGVIINYNKLKARHGHYFQKLPSKNGRKVIIRHAKKRDLRGIPLKKVRKKIESGEKKVKAAAVAVLDERKQHKLEMKRKRQARYRARLKAKKAAAAVLA